MTDEKNTSASPTPCDTAKLQIAQTLRDYHHKALWEEEKHFSWLVSIIFSANILLITNNNLGVLEKSLSIMLASLVGLILSVIGFRVLRRESENFQVALTRFVIEHNRCFECARLPEVKSCNPNKHPLKLIALGSLGKASIRDYFQLVLLLFSMIFVLCLIGAGYVAYFGA